MNPMNQQQEQPFENTPEAQEYLSKLQTERIELDSGASELEREALKNLKNTQIGIRQLSTRQGDMDKQINTLQAQRQQITKEIDLMAGEATGYARMLVSAEGARRKKAEKVAAKSVSSSAPSAPKAEDKPINDNGNGKVEHKKPSPQPKLKAVPTPDGKKNEAQV
jgi:hypothetical protein